jgi:hypothetical protein
MVSVRAEIMSTGYRLLVLALAQSQRFELARASAALAVAATVAGWGVAGAPTSCPG